MEAFIRDDQNINFERILTVCSLHAYDVWRILIGFIRLCSDMPMLMKVHLCFLEMLCFFELFWRERSPLVELIRSQASSSLIDHRRERRLEQVKNSADEKENMQPSQSLLGDGNSTISVSQNVGGQLTQLFFKRLLSVMADRIHTLCTHLNFSDRQMEFVWEIVKYLVCEQIDLLIGRHLDHLIICSIYAVSKKCASSVDGFVHKNFDDILKV